MKAKNRLGGNIGYIIFPEQYSLEIDSNHDFKFVVIKNGSFPNDVYENYKFSFSGVIKEHSSPGGNVAIASNVGFDYLNDEDYVILGEDDFMINQDNWVDYFIENYNFVDSPAALGCRIHGAQRRNNILPNSPLVRYNSKLFEVFWTDGLMLMGSDIVKKYRMDENFVGGMEQPDYCLQLIDGGYKIYVCAGLNVTHDTLQIIADKFKYADKTIAELVVKDNLEDYRTMLYKKWKDSNNENIRYFVELDLASK